MESLIEQGSSQQKTNRIRLTFFVTHIVIYQIDIESTQGFLQGPSPENTYE